MTKRERQLVVRCINDLMQEDGEFDRAIDTLIKLAGDARGYPTYTAAKHLRPTTFADIVAKGPSTFRIEIDEDTTNATNK